MSSWQRKPKGHILVDDVEVSDLLQCCHCGCQFEVHKGSGRKRGYCMRCGSVTCGDPRCHQCIPVELRCELSEKGQIHDFMEGVDPINLPIIG